MAVADCKYLAFTSSDITVIFSGARPTFREARSFRLRVRLQEIVRSSKEAEILGYAIANPTFRSAIRLS